MDNSLTSCPSPVAGAVSVIIPTLNEAGNLPYVLNTIPSWVREVIVVDGRSDDDTQRIAKVLRPDVRIVHESKRGKGADYVKGSRFCAGAGSSDITPFRRFGDASICVLLRVLFGARYSDATYGYIGIRADRLDALSLDSDGFEVETLIGIRARRARLKTAEVPCYEAHRIHGTSNLRAFHDGLRIFRTIVSERLRRYRVRAN